MAVALLKEHNIDFSYREYKKNPLSLEELQQLFQKLNIPANTVLRKREKAYKDLGLNGTEDDATLLAHFAVHPALMQRPIFVSGEKAILCRPAERILELIED